jgi:hypothetical protein
MPSLAEVVDAIRKTKGDPNFVVPIIDALMRRKTKLKGGKQ